MTSPEVGDWIKVYVVRESGSGDVIARAVNKDKCDHHIHISDGTPGDFVYVEITKVCNGYTEARRSTEGDISIDYETDEATGGNTTASEGLQELASGVDPICESQETDSNKMQSSSTEQHEKRSKELRENIPDHI